MSLRARPTAFVIRDEVDVDFDATNTPLPLSAAPSRVIGAPPSLSTRQQRLAARTATQAAPSPRLMMGLVVIALLAAAAMTVLIRVVTRPTVTRPAARHEAVAPTTASHIPTRRRRPRNPAAVPRRTHRRPSHGRPDADHARSSDSTGPQPERRDTPPPAPNATTPRLADRAVPVGPAAVAPTATPAPRTRQLSGFAREFGLDG